jgi:hypothetical protein
MVVRRLLYYRYCAHVFKMRNPLQPAKHSISHSDELILSADLVPFDTVLSCRILSILWDKWRTYGTCLQKVVCMYSCSSLADGGCGSSITRRQYHTFAIKNVQGKTRLNNVHLVAMESLPPVTSESGCRRFQVNDKVPYVVHLLPLCFDVTWNVFYSCTFLLLPPLTLKGDYSS